MIKKLLITCYLFLLSTFSHEQILSSANLDLNPGGVIYDVAYDSYTNSYIVVGDFISINGFPRFNMAFIDANTLTVKTDNPITSIDGVIRSVEVFDDGTPFYLSIPSFPPPPADGLRRFVYIGGDFNTVNGEPLVSCCRFFSNENFSSSIVQPYTLDSGWDIEINGGFGVNTVNDIDLYGDTLVLVGDFNISSPNYLNDIFSISTYNSSSTTVDYIPMFENFSNVLTTNESHFSIERVNNGYTISGNSRYSFFDNSGFLGFNFTSISGVNKYPFIDVFKNEIDTILFSSNTSIAFEGSIEKSTFNSQNGSTTHPFGIDLLGYSDSYNSKIYFASDNHLKVYRRDTIDILTEVSSLILNSLPGSGIITNPNNDFIYSTPFLLSIPVTPTPVPGTTPAFSGNETIDGYRAKRIKIINNRLFLSGDQLVNADFYNKTGLAVFCLEPRNPKDFIQFDTIICEGNTRIYTIPPVDYANGYRWNYTGNGAKIRINGDNTPFSNFSDTIINNTSFYNSNSVEILFGPGTTAGILSVTPFSTCNTATDYQFSSSKSLFLNTATLPDLSFFEDTVSITCVRDSFYLIAESTSPNVSFSWSYNNSDSLSLNDSLFIDYTDTNTVTLFDSTYFHASVYEPIEQCISQDSVFFYFDTTAQQIDTADFILTPPIFDCSTDSLNVTLSIPNASIEWDLNSGVTNPSMTNYTIYDPLDSLSFYAYVTYNQNGCRAQQGYIIPTDISPLIGVLVGYSNYGSVTVDDTLNCFQPDLILQCDVSGGTGNAEWIIGGVNSGNTLNLSVTDSNGMSNFNLKTYQFVTTNFSNGCTETNDVTVLFDLDEPSFINYSGDSSLNCSLSSLTLIHPSIGSANFNEGWLSPLTNLQTNNDSLDVTVIGEYYYEVQSSSNGCSSIDTVSIIQTNELLIDLISDTTICEDQLALINANPINNNETSSYSWSDGSTDSTITVTGGQDSYASVIIQTPSGCIGYDTVLININPPIVAEFLLSTGCSDGNIQVSNVSGGAGNYQFSLDQTNWQTNTAFTGLSLESYSIFVQDDIGCRFQFQETLTNSIGGIDVNFLVSTYNENGDTLAIVNISDFSGFDSIQWVLPSGANTFSIDDSMIVLSIDNGGWYDITLIGYQDTCAFSFTKPVFFGQSAPVFNEGYDTLGITSLNIYPNPTTGFFTVDLEFGTTQNYSIIVTNIQGQPMSSMTKTGIGKVISENFEFPFGAIPGSYSIHIISDFDANQKTIILN